MEIQTIHSRPFDDQRPGTSGLRKRVPVFQQQHYLENFVQAIFDTQTGLKGGRLILGGDGRYYNRHAIQVILRMALANGVTSIILGQGGLLSTPAASHLIRKYQAQGGIILSASHNQAGPDKDFGIKFNSDNGGPATEQVTQAIYERTRQMDQYRIAELEEINIDAIGQFSIGDLSIEVVDPVHDYAVLMSRLFDFEAIRGLIATAGFRMRFDAMYAVTGPYAKQILVDTLGAPSDSIINGEPSETFNGGHPDPNLIHAAALVSLTQGDDAVDFAAASDGDGDRNMILGRDIFVTPSDSLAIMAANAHLIPAYQSDAGDAGQTGLKGVARSMPTSQAVDLVARSLGIPCYETPTGWKFFGNLLDDGRIRLCGEESFGSGSDHIREKDGLWAVLFWLNILAVKSQSVAGIVADHWQRFGRHYYVRHDYEEIPQEAADQLIQGLISKLPGLINQRVLGHQINLADEFSYQDPVDGSITGHQGIRIGLNNGSRIVYRLSGTGTQGATLRVYLEAYHSEPDGLQLNPTEVLGPLADLAAEIAEIETLTGRSAPSLVT